MENNAEVFVPVLTNITRVESDQKNNLYQFRNNSPIPNNFVTIFDKDDHSHLIPDVETPESNLGSLSFDGKEPFSKDSSTNVDCLESSEVTNAVDSMEDNANITRVRSEQTSYLYDFFRNNSPKPNTSVIIFDEDDYSHLIPDVKTQESNVVSSSFDGKEPLSKGSNTNVDCLESSEVTKYDVDSMADNAQVFLSNITRVGSEQTSYLYDFFRNNSPKPNNSVIIFDEDDYSQLIPDVKTQESKVVSSSFDGKEPLSKVSNTNVDCLESSEVTNDVDSMEDNAQEFLSNITRVGSEQTSYLYDFFRNNSPKPNNSVIIFDEDDYSHLIPDVETQKSTFKDEKMKNSDNFDSKNTSTSMDITSSTSEIIENKNKPNLLIYYPVDESKINNISAKDVGTDVTPSPVVSEITKTKHAGKKLNKQKRPKKIKNDHLNFWDSKLMSSARTREYEGRKFSNGYYNNEHRKKSQYEKRNQRLQERLAVLYSKSCEENILIKSNESIVEYENTNHSEALSDVQYNLEIKDSLVGYTKQKNFQDKKASNQNKLEINKIPNLKCTQNATKTMPVSIKMSFNMGDNSIKQLNKPTAISGNLNCKSILDILKRPYSGASSSVVAQINISSAQNNANPVAKRPSHKRGITILTPEKINRKYGGGVEDDENCKTSETTFQPTWEAVWIECTNIPSLGWISGLRNLDNFFSFKIPGCGLSKFYPEKECFNKINIELCTRLRSLNYIAWAIRDTIDQVQGNEINTDHLNPNYILTKRGLVHAKEYIFNKYKKNQPKKNQPKKNQPKKHQPKKNQPKENQPKKNQPKKNQPKENQPKKNQPKKNQPKKNQPKKSKKEKKGTPA